VPQAFDETMPLALAITGIQRTIIESPSQLESAAQAIPLAPRPKEVIERPESAPLTELLHSRRAATIAKFWTTSNLL